tara:strand:+ start:1647 stop:3113 length:1467 start_codon:yes stop_codon:yes gene_type:complete
MNYQLFKTTEQNNARHNDKNHGDILDTADSHNSRLQEFTADMGHLKFGVRTTNCLLNAGVTKLEKLLAMKEIDLLQIPNFGMKSLDEVISKLKKFGLTLNTLRAPVSLAELDFNDEIVQICSSNGVNSLQDLVELSGKQLLSFQGISKIQVKDIFKSLSDLGLSLKENPALQEAEVLFMKGFNSAEIAEITDESEHAIKKYLDVSRLLDQGFGYATIAEKYGVTREAARRYAIRNLPEKATKEFRTQARNKRKVTEINKRKARRHHEVIQEIVNQGKCPQSILVNLGETMIVNKTAANYAISAELINDLNLTSETPIDAAFINQNNNYLHSNEELLGYLQITSHIRRKLVTRGEYEVVAEMNLTDKPWPTHQTYLLRFGTWLQACELAGVPSREPRIYEKKWTPKNITDALMSFLDFCEMTGDKATAANYEAWAPAQEIPSLTTVRKSSAGSWTEALAIAKAKLKVRKDFENKEIVSKDTIVKREALL